jgi:predicted TIM-barrel fold metal-dependent hydrolase
MRVTHTAPNLMREMREVGVAASLLLPIDFPVLSYNAEAYLEVAARHPELPALGCVHPYAADVAGKLDAQKAAGARGVKVHPAVQLMAADNERAMRLYRLCAERDLPVLFHCGPVGIENVYSRYLCSLRFYRRAVAENRDVTFVLGHSGALEMEQALALCCEFDNVYLEVSCQSVTNVRRIVQEAPSDRLMFGSDWPFYHQAIPLAKVLLATEDRKDVRPKLFWENAARVFKLTLPA